MASFKVPCPSCEHQVLITNPNQVGTKVECPKCKYRFKVEEPAGGVPKDDPKAAKGKDKGKKKAEPAAGGDAKKKNSKKLVAIAVGGLAVVILAVVGFAMMGGDDKKPSGGGNRFAGSGGGGAGGGGGGSGDGSSTDGSTDPKDKEKDKKEQEPPKKVNLTPRSDKDERATTNLLPAQTVALYRFDIDKVRQTPLGALFDPATRDMFRASFGLDDDNVATYYHAFVGTAREPFGVIRLKEPVPVGETQAKLASAETPKKVKGRSLFALKSNPFVTGATNAGSFASLFSELLDKPPAPAKTTESRLMGACVYDTQHVLVGDHQLLDKFLAGLDERGMPKLVASAEFSDNKMYLSIEPRLKRILRDLGSESAVPPAVVCVEHYARGPFDSKLLKSDFQPIGAVVEPVLNRTEYIAAALTSFTHRGVSATLRLVMVSEGAAVEAAKEHLTPGLTTATYAMNVFFNAPVEFRNYSGGYISPLGPGGSTPPGGSGDGSDEGRQGGRPGLPGGRPGGFGVQPPPSLGPATAGSGMRPSPGGAASGMQPPTMPGGLPGPGNTYPPPVDTTQPPPSHLDLTVTDTDITIAIDLSWTDDVYRRLLAPRFLGVVNTVKGKMAVFASDVSFTALSAAVAKMTEQAKQFPRGTADRKSTDVSRGGLKYRPETRVSFFADLLPYLSRSGLAVGIDRDLAWYEGNNLQVAEAWVPEFLVSTYPSSAWRTESPHVEKGRVMGGTSYVGIAGVGLDAARYDPKNPEQAKKMGIAGYDWGSKVEEVTDGLAHTIYLMQTPPGLPQPWLAGGGATIRGLDETDPMRGFRHTFNTPGGKPGTFALMGNGDVRFIPGDIKPDLLLAMATRAGGENIADRIDKEAPLVLAPAGKGKEAELKTDASPGPARSDAPVDPKGDAKPEAAPGPRDKK